MSVKRVLLAVVVVVFAFPVVEGLSSFGLLASDISRLKPPPANFRQAAYDSLVGWIGLPNLANRDNFGPGIVLTTDAAGLRIHRPTPAVPPAGETRILCSGASFTFGSGVADSETFCAALETILPHVRTVNAAQRGYGIDQSYLWYKREARNYPHQLQLFAVNGTDFERTAESNLNGYPKPTLVLKDNRLVPQNVPVPQWKGWSRWNDAGPALSGLRIPKLLAGGSKVSDSAQYRRVDDQLWPMVEAVFRELDDQHKKDGSALVLVYLPTVEEYVSGARDERRTRLAATAQTAGIAFVDLTADLRQVPRDSVQWLFITPNTIPVGGITGHYSARGHRWIAENLARHFLELPPVATALRAVAR